ncbi:RagB/SusD family nutrient uptake outer membrane protein, partial [Rhizobium ruizarguesonis]
MINDSAKTEGVSSLIWEIRNERRVELELEGKRYNDLRRWGELWRADNEKNPKQDMGAWIDKDFI